MTPFREILYVHGLINSAVGALGEGRVGDNRVGRAAAPVGYANACTSPLPYACFIIDTRYTRGGGPIFIVVRGYVTEMSQFLRPTM